MAERLIIRNGFVLTMDDTIGDVPGGDVLVEDGVIAAVGVGLPAADAEVVDATGCVVIPGLVDTHRHLWQTVVRGVLPSCTLETYFGAMLATLAPAFRAEDVHAGGLLGSLDRGAQRGSDHHRGLVALPPRLSTPTPPSPPSRKPGSGHCTPTGPPAGLEWWVQSGVPTLPTPAGSGNSPSPPTTSSSPSRWQPAVRR